jgi:hypothetical protein
MSYAKFTARGRGGASLGQRSLERICPAPDQCRSLEDYQRLNHRDLVDTATPLLVRERARAEERVMKSDPQAPDDRWAWWFEERILAIEAELTARCTDWGL